MSNYITKIKNRSSEIILACCKENLNNLKLNGTIKKVYVLFYVLKAILINLKRNFN